jgi:hypothetical protein
MVAGAVSGDQPPLDYAAKMPIPRGVLRFHNQQ